MKRYKAKFNPDALNVFAVSLVEEPAMEGEFVSFEKHEEIKFKEISKNRFMGLILEPNKEIYRNQNGREFTISIPEDEVKQFAYNFQKQGFQNNSTFQHDGEPLKGVSFVETWLIENPQIDKSTNFGFSYPKGSWMGVMEFENEEVAKQYKEGKIKGFSIDAYFELEEINLKSNIEMSIEKSGLEKAIDKLADIISFSNKPKEVEVALMEEKEEDKKKEVLENIDLEVPVLEEEEEKVEEVKAEKVEIDLDDFIAKIKALLQPMQDEVVSMKTQITELEKVNENLNKEVVELGKQPATKSVKSAPSQVDFSKMTEFEKYKYFKNNG